MGFGPEPKHEDVEKWIAGLRARISALEAYRCGVEGRHYDAHTVETTEAVEEGERVRERIEKHDDLRREVDLWRGRARGVSSVREWQTWKREDADRGD